MGNILGNIYRVGAFAPETRNGAMARKTVGGGELSYDRGVSVSDIFDRFGFPVAAFARIRGGRGVVGRTAQVMIVALVVLGTIAWRIGNETLLMIAGAAIIIFVLAVLLFLLRWATKNPELAVGFSGLQTSGSRSSWCPEAS